MDYVVIILRISMFLESQEAKFFSIQIVDYVLVIFVGKYFSKFFLS